MTAQIYLNNLLHGYMDINDANLIIFDECHHAVSHHPFRQVSYFYCSLISLVSLLIDYKLIKRVR